MVKGGRKRMNDRLWNFTDDRYKFMMVLENKKLMKFYDFKTNNLSFRKIKKILEEV